RSPRGKGCSPDAAPVPDVRCPAHRKAGAAGGRSCRGGRFRPYGEIPGSIFSVRHGIVLRRPPASCTIFELMNTLYAAEVFTAARMASGMTSRARRPLPLKLAG